ncbi:beta-N-acetylhexosaminidase family protein [Amycolatopsis sp. H20-H5]|uniref:beta-N-acetylhexosaminidase family protein n=1 Tax=Amycolatopsis sp. H20-H5 TaxID=3046309 RepID=UPI002DB7B84B|nr:beta-N-acetylglucosaminidase domain-containing protein [Amycolatopsis sp. H20-H5]MEC3982566.1 beta-N-acetylglucosaminidase domain-containing protein [Amycolatopsis sp. H20-H5]
MSPRSVLAVVLALVVAAVVVTPAGASTGQSRPSPLPVVTPSPQQMTPNGREIRVPREVALVLGKGVDAPTEALVRQSLTRAGARDIRLGGRGALKVVVGAIDDQVVSQALSEAGGTRPAELAAEGYSLAGKASGRGGVVALAGNDGDGTYYAAQTFRQLVGKAGIAAVSVVDHPLMALRGSIEGFYGAPWSHADRLDQLAFYGDVKANTYIYTPKDDVYLRDKWREPYPAVDLASLKELVDAAKTHHVQFTYAVSPGLSICYSDPADVQKLKDKLASLHAVGARSFYVALDDISYTKWNCDNDQQKYGAPGQAAAGRAQADLLNAVQGCLDTLADAKPLQMVPTEYSDIADSPYKKVLRETLDKRVVVQWTGTAVVPPSISVADAEKASEVWGRKVFLWDNYPVNDYGQTAGRLLLAPYDKREAGLHEALGGIVLNPMNQASASKVALFGGASFAWNDTAYDPARTWRAAADYLSGGDRRTTEALLAFFDTQHLAPTFGDTPWQPQAPVLKAKTDAIRAGKPLRDLKNYAELLAGAPARIRSGVADPAFAAEAKPWLDALALWGAALKSTVDGLASGDDKAFQRAAELAAQASAIHTIPGTTRPQGPIKVADGVLDKFIADAPGLVRR